MYQKKTKKKPTKKNKKKVLSEPTGVITRSLAPYRCATVEQI
jgi:hypothetical protein